MTKPDRLYRARPPTEFKGSLVARLDPTTNVVTFNEEVFDLKDSRDLRFLRSMDDVEDEIHLQH